MSNVYGRVNSGFNSVLCKSAAEVAFKYAANVSDLPSKEKIAIVLRRFARKTRTEKENVPHSTEAQ